MSIAGPSNPEREASADVAARTVGTTRGWAMARLVHGELLKITTTGMWRIFAIGAVVTTSVALLANIANAHRLLTTQYQPGTIGGPAGDLTTANLQLQANTVTQAANVFTSGQFFGGLFAMLLGILLIANEDEHQTATATFLATPRRTAVIIAKFIGAMLGAALFWLIATALDLVGGVIFFNAMDRPDHLGDWSIIRSILLNLMVFALWAVFGIGIGVLIRSQLAATVMATVVYVVGSNAAQIIFELVYLHWIKKAWVLTTQVIVPPTAAEVAVSPTQTYLHSPPQWVGVAVLLGYGLILSTIGTLIIRKRDIS